MYVTNSLAASYKKTNIVTYAVTKNSQKICTISQKSVLQ